MEKEKLARNSSHAWTTGACPVVMGGQTCIKDVFQGKALQDRRTQIPKKPHQQKVLNKHETTIKQTSSEECPTVKFVIFHYPYVSLLVVVVVVVVLLLVLVVVVVVVVVIVIVVVAAARVVVVVIFVVVVAVAIVVVVLPPLLKPPLCATALLRCVTAIATSAARLRFQGAWQPELRYHDPPIASDRQEQLEEAAATALTRV